MARIPATTVALSGPQAIRTLGGEGPLTPITATVTAAPPKRPLGKLTAPIGTSTQIDAAQAVRDRLKRDFGYEADDQDVQSILAGGDIKVRTRVPTLQRLKDEALLTGYYEGKPTLEREEKMALSLGYWGDRPTLAREQFEALYFGTGTGGRTTLQALESYAIRTGITVAPDLTASRLGVEIARYYDSETQRITDPMGLKTAKDAIRSGASTLGVELTEDEVNKLTLGGTVSGKLIRTPEGARVGLEEKRVGLEEKRVGLEERVVKREDDRLYGFVLKNEDGTTTRVFGTLEMSWHQSQNSLVWQKLMEEGGDFVDPMTGKITHVAGRQKWEMDRETRENTKQYGGWVSVRGPSGQSTLVYVEGDRAFDAKQRELDRDLTRTEGQKERDLRKTLSDNTISAQEKLQAVDLASRAGENALDRNLQKILSDDRISSTEKLALIDAELQTNLTMARLTSAEREGALNRLHDINLKLGHLVVDNSAQGFHWEYGSQYTPEKIQQMAADLGVSEWEVELLLEDNADFRKQVAEWIGIRLQAKAGMKAADAERAWQSIENALDRNLQETLSDKRLSATEKLAKIERDQLTWTGIMNGVAGLAETGLKIWSAKKLADMVANRGLDATLSAIGKGAATEAFWLEMGATPEEAKTLAGADWGSFMPEPDAVLRADSESAAPLGAQPLLSEDESKGLLAKFGGFGRATPLGVGGGAVGFAALAWLANRSFNGQVYGHLNDRENVTDWTSLYNDWWKRLPYDTQIAVAGMIESRGAGRFNDAGELIALDFGDKGLIHGDGPGKFTGMLDELYLMADPTKTAWSKDTPRADRVGLNPFMTALGNMEANPATLLRAYWKLYDGEVFQKEAGSLTQAQGRDVIDAWKLLPGEARLSRSWRQGAPDARDVAGMTGAMNDLAAYGAGKGFMSRNELAQTYFEQVMPILERVTDWNQLTVDERNLLEVVLDQASAAGGGIDLAALSPDEESPPLPGPRGRRSTRGYRRSSIQAAFELLKNPDRLPEETRDVLFGRGTQADWGRHSMAELRNDAMRESSIPGEQMNFLTAGMSEDQQRHLLWMLGNGQPLLTQDIDALFGTTNGANPTNKSAYLMFRDLLNRGFIRRYNTDVPLGSD